MDSLRAIAALAIVAYHVAPHAGAFRSEFTTAVSAQLSTGVALFFLISGTLLYRPFVLAHATGERPPDVRAYAWRRFLRIVPAYWAALTVTGIFIDPAVFERPLLFYGFAQVYSPGAVFQGIPVAWTLCIEVSFYAFLPIFALALRGVAKRTRASVWRVEAIAMIALFVFGRGLAGDRARRRQRVGADLGQHAAGLPRLVRARNGPGGHIRLAERRRREARVRALRGARAGCLLGAWRARRWRSTPGSSAGAISASSTRTSSCSGSTSPRGCAARDDPAGGVRGRRSRARPPAARLAGAALARPRLVRDLPVAVGDAARRWPTSRRSTATSSTPASGGSRSGSAPASRPAR